MESVLEKIPEELRSEVQAEINRVAGNVRSEVKKQFSDYDDLKSRAARVEELENQLSEVTQKLSAFEKAEKDRKKSEQSELERLQAELQEAQNALKEKSTYVQDLESKFEALTGELNEAKSWREAREAAEKAAIEKALDGLSDDDKALVEKLPLDQQMAFINRLKAQKPGQGVPSEKPVPKKGKDFYTREEVERMTKEEISQNLDAINSSMSKW